MDQSSILSLLKDHGALNASVSDRIAADARLASARAFMLRGIGAGAVMLGLGGAIGLGFFGYSTITDMTSTTQRIADVVTRAVAGVELQATGAVAMAPGSQVTLTPGGSVSLTPGATVGMDPAATVKAVNAPPPGSAPAAMVVQKSVEGPDGQTLTQWLYDKPDATAPRQQLCYRLAAPPRPAETTPGDGARTLTLVAIDGQRTGGAGDEAATRDCAWFSPPRP